jgi:hypothetical protein
LFSALTLPAGTYYLTLSSADNAGNNPGAIWPTECASGCPLTLDAGVTLLPEGYANTAFGAQDADFPPASTFVAGPTPVNLTVTGNAGSAAPEPPNGAQMLAGVGLLALAMLRGRKGARRG